MTPLVARYIKPLMLVSGVLTSTMLYAALFPAAALSSTFGESLHGPVAETVVRNWAALIGIVGAMLIYGAFDVASRRIALAAAAVSKTIFISLVLANGTRFLAYQAGVAVLADGVMVALFVIYLAGGYRQTAQA